MVSSMHSLQTLATQAGLAGPSVAQWVSSAHSRQTSSTQASSPVVSAACEAAQLAWSLHTQSPLPDAEQTGSHVPASSPAH